MGQEKEFDLMQAITFPPDYEYGLTAQEIVRYWPKLLADKFHFTSKKNVHYNCMTWAIAQDTVSNENVTEDDVFWMDMMMYFQHAHDLDPLNLDHSAKGYADCLEKHYRFTICNNGEFEEGTEKIALYENKDHEWSHIARQLENGNWTSKMGKLEDIEHYSLEVLNGKLYGEPKLFMGRPRNK
jgi:hypothetical protein